jgi:hypothetical protein
MTATYDIVDVEYLGGYQLRLTFADRTVGVVDLASKFDGPVGPMFEPLRDPVEFARVRVDPDLGTVIWPNGADLAPDVLHEQAVAVS